MSHRDENESGAREIPQTPLSRRSWLQGAALVSAAAAASACATAQAKDARETRGAPLPRGKVALVTGSSRGIGAAIAKRLARDGFSVTVNCVVNRELAAAVVREIGAAGGRARWEQADVSDPAAVKRLFDGNERAFGGVDVVVNNAGIMRLATFQDMTDEDFSRTIDVNLRGGFHVLREAARRVRDGGRIVSTSSSITLLRSPKYGPYAASKASLEIFSSVLAKELRGRGISVNAVAPGVVDTPLFTDGKTPQEIAGFVQRTPHGRLGNPADIAAVVSALCSQDGSWVNGQTVFANGGIV